MSGLILNDVMVFDFRLKVFCVVAERLSFTKAAQELFITQPAVTKHIRELEQHVGMALFIRQGTGISLTTAGQVLYRHAVEIFKVYANMENELSQLSRQPKGMIKTGASTTLAQYVLPRILAMFKKMHPAINFSFISGNSEFIEQQVLNGAIDVGLVEGVSNHQQIAYEPFVKDEIVLVGGAHSIWSRKSAVRVKQLASIPLVMRETGSGTLDVVLKALAKLKVKLKDLEIELQLGSTESIKEYIQFSDCLAFLSKHAIARELEQNKLVIIPIKDLEIYRTFQFIQPYGQQTKLSLLFQRFCLTHYNYKL